MKKTKVANYEVDIIEEFIATMQDNLEVDILENLNEIYKIVYTISLDYTKKYLKTEKLLDSKELEATTKSMENYHNLLNKLDVSIQIHNRLIESKYKIIATLNNLLKNENKRLFEIEKYVDKNLTRKTIAE